MLDKKVCTKCKDGARKVWAKGLCARCYNRKRADGIPGYHSIVWQRVKKDGRKEILKAARRRAQQRTRPFDLCLKDIIIPEICPILGIRLVAGMDYPTESSPSLDEIVVGKGYVPGNIQIISRKANTMKSNATPEELKKFAEWITRQYGT